MEDFFSSDILQLLDFLLLAKNPGLREAVLTVRYSVRQSEIGKLKEQLPDGLTYRQLQAGQAHLWQGAFGAWRIDLRVAGEPVMPCWSAELRLTTSEIPPLLAELFDRE